MDGRNMRTFGLPGPRAPTADSRRRSALLATAGVVLAEVVRSMQHFTCDVCGKPMAPGDDRRYVVKMDVYAAHDPAELTDADLDVDQLEEVSQMLSDESAAETTDLAPAFKQF